MTPTAETLDRQAITFDSLVEIGMSTEEADDLIFGRPPVPPSVAASGAEAVHRWKLTRELALDHARRLAPHDPAIASRVALDAIRLTFQAEDDFPTVLLEEYVANLRAAEARLRRRQARRERWRRVCGRLARLSS